MFTMATTALGTVLHDLRRQAQEGLTDGELLDRFISRHDEAAFEGLLRRHGPMVLGACRRVLQNEVDAEDAFQATFLVLIRKAASIRPRAMVGNWLYGVAHTTALKARAMTTRRFAKEREAAVRRQPISNAEESERLHQLLDQELKVLPDKYRAAIVLCDLEGMSISAAARQLGCPPGTVGTRLARGRRLLSRRLASHGLSVPACGIAASIDAAAAAVPPSLIGSTIKAATISAMGQATASGVISAKVAALADGVIKTMLLTKLKIVTAAALMTAMVGIIASEVDLGLAAGKPAQAAQKTRRGPEQGGYQLASASLEDEEDSPDARRKDLDAIKEERKRFEGAWKIVAIEKSGTALPEAAIEEIARVKATALADDLGLARPKGDVGGMVIRHNGEDAWTLETGTGIIVGRGTNKIDPGKKPKTMDETGTTVGNKKEITRLAIYEFLNDDKYRVCSAEPGKERPDSFSTRADDGRTVWVLQRIKTEFRGTLNFEMGRGYFITMKSRNPAEPESRVWLRISEDKALVRHLQGLTGKEVIAKGNLRQMAADTHTSVPPLGMYLAGFEIEGVAVRPASSDKAPQGGKAAIDVIGAGETAMELFKTTKDPDARWMALRILGSLRYERAIPLLLESLSDPHHYVRSNAARALGDMQVVAAGKPMIEMLKNETNGGVIQQTSGALSHLHCTDAVPALKSVANHEDVQTRMWVLQAIGGLGGKADVGFLARYLLDDASSSVQSSAAQAIEQITGADFGFPKRSGPSSPDAGLKRAKEWWQEHKGEFGGDEKPKNP
jgi:RNA polymerase sigma factor (sigma-70 family)